MSSGGMPSRSGVPSRHRDIETEELIEDQQHQIREFERQVNTLKEKLMVAKQQLIGQGGSRGPSRKQVTRSSSNSRAAAGHLMASPVPASLGAGPPGPLLSQQAQRLLEEARNENRMLEENLTALKEQINIFEQEIEQQREQHKIKESNYEEEIQILKAQVLDGQRHTATENIQLIQLHKDNNLKSSQVQTLKAQVEGLEEQVSKLKSECEIAQRDSKELSSQLQEEQQKAISLSQKLGDNVQAKQALQEAEEKARDFQKENSILRESNNKLLDSAYNLERERNFQASENALKVQISQLESTLKSDLMDKKALQDALSKEREQFAKLETEFQDLQGKYFSTEG